MFDDKTYLSVDPGFVNAAMVCFSIPKDRSEIVVEAMMESDLKKKDGSGLLTWSNCLGKGFQPLISGISEWFYNMPKELRSIDVMVIESQNKYKMSGIMCAVASTFLAHNALMTMETVTPTAVVRDKDFNGLIGNRTRPEKKRATKFFVERFVMGIIHKTNFVTGKLELQTNLSYDLCDCFLNFIYYLKHKESKVYKDLKAGTMKFRFPLDDFELVHKI